VESDTLTIPPAESRAPDFGRVDPEHARLLIASRIAPEIARERGYSTVHNDNDLTAEGYADWQARLVPGLLVPMFDVFGENGSSQFRPDTPRERDGSPVKYETPEGSRNLLDVHPRMTRFLADPKAILFVTEGVKKADSLTTFGYPTIALSGVWNWRGTNEQGGTTALADWDAIALNGRQVYIVFDSDARTNVQVQRAAARLAEYLKLKQAWPIIVVPPSPSGVKVGVDDYFMAGGTVDDLLVLDNYLDPETAPAGRGWVDGGTFLFDIPTGTPAVWGDDRHVLWAEGESLLIAGPQGVRKTTTAGHLGCGLAGVPGFEEVYGKPVARAKGKIVYLALDRPRQIARCLRRLCPEEYRELLEAKLDFWQGGLPFNVLKEENDDALADWLLERGASHLIVDSLKDVAGRLSDEEVGAKLNAIFQRCITAGIEVCILHHNRKANADNKRPKALADVHGSENLTRGVGSVVCLFGAAGDQEIELSHLKQPAEVVGPLVLYFDDETGRGSIERHGMLATGKKAERSTAIRSYFFNLTGIGTTLGISDLVTAGFGSENTVREALDQGVEMGWLHYFPGAGAGNRSVWTLVAPLAVKP
jgi:Domain of unknown function (DUF3854)/AAA domain